MHTIKLTGQLIFLKAHTPFTTIADAIASNSDIEDMQVLSVEEFKTRMMVSETDKGQEIKELIRDLTDLLELYQGGSLPETLQGDKDNPFV